MKANFYKNGMIFAIVVLIIGASVVSSTSSVTLTANKQSMVNVKGEIANSGDGQEYWALLVACGVYADYPDQNRPLMLEEVDDLHDVLLQSNVWSEDHIKVIKGEDATTSNIIDGLRWLDKMEDSDDISLVFLSTHGAPIGFDIPPLDEADGTDEALITYWGFAYPNSFIWDDELNVLLNRLESKGVCLIVDSCYAGGFNDPSDWNRTQQLYGNIQMSATEWMNGFAEDVRGQSRVVLMGSREDELSYSGGFAPYLIDGLRGFADSNKDGIVTAEEAFFYVEPRPTMQHPTMYDGYTGELPLIYLNTKSQEICGIKEEHNAVDTETLGSYILASAPPENSIVCGYVVDNDTGDPIEGAVVNLTYWEDYQGDYGFNSTFTDSDGFYSMNLAAGEFRLMVYAEGYCSGRTWHNEVGENETAWINFSLYPRPPENSIVCGYVVDDDTGDPIEGAHVSLEWGDSHWHFYDNETTSDTSGFFSMNVAAGEIYIEARANGYFPGFGEDYTIGDYETVYFNFSLHPRPLENAIACGYITDEKTGIPIKNARVNLEWLDVNLEIRYQNETVSDSSGFFSMNVAAGEIYFGVMAGFGYREKSTYRYDAEENKTLWANISLVEDSIQVDLTKPLAALYRNNNRIVPSSRAEIFGSMDIEAYVHSYWYRSMSVDRVEFYIDGVLKATVTSEPYTWTWSEQAIGKHTIKVIAYDHEGNTATDEIEVWKFFSLNNNQQSQSNPQSNQQSNPSPNQQTSQQNNQLIQIMKTKTTNE